MDVIGLTFGQFSLLDLIEATLEITGPADVTISTWSAGFYDVDAAQRFAALGLIRSIRWVMDAHEKRGQAMPVGVANLFGQDSIRVFRTHAKFVVLRNAEWDVLITTSMNLNLNPRCEQFEMTDDAERAALFSDFVDELFRGVPEGVLDDRSLPEMALPEDLRLPEVDPARSFRVGGKVATGPWRRGAPRE